MFFHKNSDEINIQHMLRFPFFTIGLYTTDTQKLTAKSSEFLIHLIAISQVMKQKSKFSE